MFQKSRVAIGYAVVLTLACTTFMFGLPARASHCGPGEFSVSGTVSDQASGLPLTVTTTVNVFAIPGDVTRGSTTTVLPSSTYQICLPVAGATQYGVTFSAPGYVSPRADADAWIDPIPSAGTHLVINEGQAQWEDIIQSELFFYRGDGLYRAYDPASNGSLPRPLVAGTAWPQTGAWQFSYLPATFSFASGVAHLMFAYGPAGEMAVQPDPVSYHQGGFDAADVQDLGTDPGWDIVTAGWQTNTVLFYRSDGTYQWRYASEQMGGGWTIEDLGPSGSRWTTGWTSIVPIDLNGDGTDELLFYRKSDGLFRYYYIRSGGSVSSPIVAGDGYTTGWDSITAVDLDGDNQDEIFFYREDGLFRFYDIRSNGSLPKPMLAGDGYTKDWDSITRFESCLVRGSWECPFVG